MRVLLSGGGTAGHINPALAIASKIKKEHPDAEIAFVGTPKGMENKLVTRAGYPIYHVDVKGFSRKKTLKSVLDNAGALYKAMTSPLVASKIIKSFSPDIVIGTGGYVSWPVLRAAATKGIPTVIHEQNAVVGVTTKMLSKIVDKVMISFEESRAQLDVDERKIVLVGNPVNSDMLKVSKEDERKKLKITDKPYVLSYGGSLGAKAINNNIFEIIKKGGLDGKIYHTHGVGSYEWRVRENEIKEINNLNKEGIEIVEYIYDMPSKMAASDLVISRAGAITLSELAVLGKPAILIPSPNVTDNHQYKNAMVVAEAGGAVVIEEKNLSDEFLESEIKRLVFDKDALKRMSDCMKKLAIPDTDDRIYGVIKGALEARK